MIHRHKRITAAKGLLSLCLAFVLLWGLCPFAAAQEEMGAAAAVQVEEPPRDEAPVEGAAATADTDIPSAEEAASSLSACLRPPGSVRAHNAVLRLLRGLLAHMPVSIILSFLRYTCIHRLPQAVYGHEHR